jgi:hypothetical protein
MSGTIRKERGCTFRHPDLSSSFLLGGTTLVKQAPSFLFKKAWELGFFFLYDCTEIQLVIYNV